MSSLVCLLHVGHGLPFSVGSISKAGWRRHRAQAELAHLLALLISYLLIHWDSVFAWDLSEAVVVVLSWNVSGSGLGG